ncbi:MAG: effector binding domain-containing protein [Bacteroidota bacterium]|nr:effector binding domain-containing protein [Bacteroidota bacterium]
MENFKIIGISVRTTNQNKKAVEDIGKLWGQFFAENILAKVENKIGNEIYSIYTDYKSDYTDEYTTILGVRVNNLDNIPDGLIGREFQADTFTKFIAKGEMPNSVVEIWKEVWSKDKELNRKYTYDFEVYGEKSQNGKDSEVEIFIATN